MEKTTGKVREFCQSGKVGTMKASFTRTVNATVFVSGIFDLLNVMCKQHHRSALNPFLNCTKNDDVDGKCK